MTLLLGGTLRSLWLYYLTINRIRSRMDEQIAAHYVQMAVADLTSEESLPSLVHSDRPGPPTPFEKEPKVVAVNKAFAKYEERLEEAIEQNIDPALGPMELGLL